MEVLKLKKYVFCLFWIIVAIVICMNENTTTGTIEKVCDGDTVYVKTAAGDSLKVRL